MTAKSHSSPRRPATWALILAFALVYVSWGTTYLAIKRGVKDEHLPPALFGGVRVCLAGLILLGYLALRGEDLRLTRRDLFGVTLGGVLLFVGGNNLLALAERTVPSGVAAIIAATTPLWIAVLEMFWPRGDRLAGRGWLGVVIGLGGVILLFWPKLHQPTDFLVDVGPLLMLGSAASWSLGALFLRHWRLRAPHLTTAAYQMAIGGACQALTGVAAGEIAALPAEITPGAVGAFVYLLIVGSLIGFVAFNWLLGHVPAARVGTYAYVNPIIALFVGSLVDGEELTVWALGGIVVILTGVALVRGGARPGARAAVESPADELGEPEEVGTI
jgi:drug/metabolite transporter (DMT)-like permease